MGWEADRMQDEAMRWAYESQVCPNGHRYLEEGYGCPRCEMDAEVEMQMLDDCYDPQAWGTDDDA